MYYINRRLTDKMVEIVDTKDNIKDVVSIKDLYKYKRRGRS